MTRFLSQPAARDPRRQIPLSDGKNTEVRGEPVDFDAILDDARRNYRCPECGEGLDLRYRTTIVFCSAPCRYRFRDRRRYAENPERERERARNYYAANREKVLAKAAARRGKERPPERTTCEECGDPLTGRRRIICGKSSCRDARFKRTNPEGHAKREAAKVERRREARRAAREGGS